MTSIARNHRMVTISGGLAGDKGCYGVFYFTIDSGEFASHGLMQEEVNDEE